VILERVSHKVSRDEGREGRMCVRPASWGKDESGEKKEHNAFEYVKNTTT
jgi:hypothetical protein